MYSANIEQSFELFTAIDDYSVSWSINGSIFQKEKKKGLTFFIYAVESCLKIYNAGKNVCHRPRKVANFLFIRHKLSFEHLYGSCIW